MQQLFKFIVDGFTSPGSVYMWAILVIAGIILAFIIEVRNKQRFFHGRNFKVPESRRF
jgi:hypothetical protein